MKKARLIGSLALTKLKHAIVEMPKKDGSKVKGVFLPIEANYLIDGKKHVYLPVAVMLHEKDEYDHHGFISQQVQSEMYKSADDQQKEVFNALPIIGNLRLLGAESDSNISDEFDSAPGGDLPF